MASSINYLIHDLINFVDHKKIIKFISGIRLLIVKFIFTPAAHRLDMKPLTLNPGKNSEREKLKVAINQKR